MGYEEKNIGHLIVKIPISRVLSADGENVSFAFEPFQFLSEKLDVEYMHTFLHLMEAGGYVETMLDYTDLSALVDEFKESLETRIRELKTA